MILRPPRTRDIGAIQTLLRDNAAHLRPWSPRAREGTNPTSLVEIATQISRQRAQWREDRTYAVFLEHRDTGRLVGRIALSEVVRGAFQSAYLGYWIDHRWAGRGLTTEAVARMLELAFGPLGLHRIQAAVMPRNAPSRRVLAKLRFREEGFAPRYLSIAGAWEDHVIYARTVEDP